LRRSEEYSHQESATRLSLSEIARLGFVDLATAQDVLAKLPEKLFPLFRAAADPDQALRLLTDLQRRAPVEVDALLSDESAAQRLVQLLGASVGLGAFLFRNPEELSLFTEAMEQPASAEHYYFAKVLAVLTAKRLGGCSGLPTGESSPELQLGI